MKRVPWFFILFVAILSYIEISAIADQEHTYYPEMTATLHSNKLEKEDLVITAPHPHHYEFGIKTPSGRLLLIYNILYDDIPMVNPNEMTGFWEATTYTFNVFDLMGVFYEDSRPVTVKVFTDPGIYCLHFSSNFETHLQGLVI